MTEFWESSFREKQEMWGWNPADSAIEALSLFKSKGLSKILIPGFGYGRNAKIFTDNGFKVAGIEISQSAIDLARKHFDETVKIYHGSVSSMPFDEQLYDGIFSYALIHLLNPNERMKLIYDCYNQLKRNGIMVFVSISKMDFRYGQGEEVGKDTFENSHGINLFFYDVDSIQSEFGNYGLIDAKIVNEPLNNSASNPLQRFWFIICKKKD